MAPKSRYAVKRQPSAGFIVAGRSFDVGDGGENVSELSELNKKQNQLEFYNLNLEQIKLSELRRIK
jgi:hypothetical protein